MRTFQYSDAKSHKFWNIEVTGTSYTVTYGKVGGKGQTQTKSFASAAEAEAAADKLVKEKTGKGYRETTPSASAGKNLREALEQSIVENPADLASYMALADHLQEEGDPRGEFIQVQLALEKEGIDAGERKRLQAREKALLKAHREEWVGPWAGLVESEDPSGRGQLDFPGPKPVRFRRGILDAVFFDQLTVNAVRGFIQAPQAALVRELYIGGTQWDDSFEDGPDIPEGVDEDDAAFHVLLRWPHLGNIRVFQMGWTSDEDYDDFCHFQCHQSGTLAHAFVRQMPRLEELYLFVHNVDAGKIFSLDLPRLRVLQLYHSTDYPLEKLANNASMTRLTHLLCHPHAVEDEPSIQLRQLRAVVRSPHLSALTHLRLRLSTFGDEGCREIVQSGILGRLEVLDLRHGCIGDEGARTLASSPDLPRLRLLDVSRNELTREGIAALQATGVPLNVARMHGPTSPGDDAAEYLYEGDYE